MPSATRGVLRRSAREGDAPPWQIRPCAVPWVPSALHRKTAGGALPDLDHYVGWKSVLPVATVRLKAVSFELGGKDSEPSSL